MAIDRSRGYMPLRDAIDQLFAGSFITPQAFSGSGSYPPVDLYLSENDVVLQMCVPGVNPNDINIQVTGDTVTVSGEIKREQQGQKGQASFEEIWRGKFQRSFSLPTEVDPDKANASYENGMLSLTLPKSEATKPRKIQVSSQQTITQQGRGTNPMSGTTETEKIPVQSS